MPIGDHAADREEDGGGDLRGGANGQQRGVSHERVGSTKAGRASFTASTDVGTTGDWAMAAAA